MLISVASQERQALCWAFGAQDRDAGFIAHRRAQTGFAEFDRSDVSARDAVGEGLREFKPFPDEIGGQPSLRAIGPAIGTRR
jgi:hypothetical protein